MDTWTWQTWDGQTLHRAELYRRCAAVCARGIPRGTQIDPVCTAAAVVMAGDPAFDRAPAVIAALGPFHDAYPLGHYHQATAVATFLRVAAELDEREAGRLATLAEGAPTLPSPPGDPAEPAGPRPAPSPPGPPEHPGPHSAHPGHRVRRQPPRGHHA